MESGVVGDRRKSKYKSIGLAFFFVREELVIWRIYDSEDENED